MLQKAPLNIVIVTTIAFDVVMAPFMLKNIALAANTLYNIAAKTI